MPAIGGVSFIYVPKEFSSMFGSLKHQVSRRITFLTQNGDIGFVDRLRIAAMPQSGCAAIQYLLDNRLIDDPDDPHFEIQGHKIRFQPNYEISDRARLMQGIGQVLVETFVFPELFNRHVFIRPGDVVLDLGANIGTTALLFSELAGATGKVYAFEPVVHDLCRSNVERNGGPGIVVVPLGVSDKSERCEFSLTDFCLDSALHESKPADQYHSTRTADVVQLDDWVAENKLDRIDFIKMDIEGAEENALRGARAIIERFRPKWSVSSYHIDQHGEPQHTKLASLLKSMGYSVEELGRQHIFAW